ncbi:hypothetical protein [Nocardioides bizhenqiangii]|uniref:DUF5067 domain-containing protein n=1 Tax=Nocardioides bizhenqiangii TaxID=3095076 RepID=A0ABZ0ZTE0_9ACTN|nr:MULTISPECIES: hypothetical protein [unclassified Nocardioides]MDZ5621993.1 hypothetical protein [Nocardioides sp. HM23]WQQ27330.1 hypothetical protein SHK19_03665 [Nocardioides sp. HM61]
MADQPDPPDPPEKWRVYEEDKTPDPEPPPEPPKVPYGDAPPAVPYGQQQSYNPVFVTTSSSSAPKIVLLVVAVAVLGVVAAAAVAIFAAVDGGVAGLGGIDAKSPDDFEEFVDQVEEDTGSTEVFWVGLYDGYIIVDVPYTDEPGEDREVSYRWDGGGLEKSSQGTSTDQLFDLTEINPEIIDGICDPLLDLAQGATAADCYVFITKPGPPFGGEAWFRTSAQDEFNRNYSIDYDKDGNEVGRTVP